MLKTWFYYGFPEKNQLKSNSLYILDHSDLPLLLPTNMKKQWHQTSCCLCCTCYTTFSAPPRNYIHKCATLFCPAPNLFTTCNTAFMPQLAPLIINILQKFKITLVIILKNPITHNSVCGLCGFSFFGLWINQTEFVANLTPNNYDTLLLLELMGLTIY